MHLRAISRGFFSNSIQTLSLTPIRPYADTPIRWSFVVAALPRCDLMFKFLACRHLRVGRTFETFVAGTTNVGYWTVRVTDRHDQ
jgi:hypothetical protein